ncbi:DedA family protein [Aliiglaciecola sp. CAU 1673]|uniref:YqaA family protein n=1 Tax=Aliiglaciecola sp. CAU 1673 TaxID=3032595 RepID=UPI0023DB3271|nr:YqaA family protein [Aliiglaciecola sp. CAU 1673]MDF2180299.1 DedA family protein [Aliiglaciecola sp. CAU 1673]
MDYLLLFGASFLAATFLPFYSEVFLFALAKQGEPGWLLVLVATLGNTLGAVVNWVLGKYLLHFKDRRWFYFKDKQLESAQRWFQKYGIWSLLFSWLPIGGDALTFIAGVMKVRIVPFLILVGFGKGIRYLVILGISASVSF